MKIAIVGAGAIGGFIGTQLAATGAHEVGALARGATLVALRQHGWLVRSGDVVTQAPCRASDSPEQLGVQDLLVIAVKAPALPALAPTLQAMIGPQTMILPAMNGVPWWFCQNLPGMADQALQSVDPGGGIAAALPLAQVLGCVVHMSCSTPEPGLVLHKMGRGLIIGEPAASAAASARVDALAELLRAAGLEVTASADVRKDIWYKLWGNLTMNPVSAITGATIDRMLGDPLVRSFCTQAMEEAALIGQRIGCPVTQTPEDRHAVTQKLGAFKTSMLQDVEAGRPIELDAIVGAVHEIARRLDMATPSIDALFGLTRLFARQRGLYPSPP